LVVRERKKEVARENYTLISLKTLIPSQIFRVITSKSRGMGCAYGMNGEKRNKRSFLVGNVKEIHLLIICV
jgi:hypothetical protein